MKNWPEQLYRLLPAVYQIRDSEQAEALRMLLHVIGEQVQDVQDNIESLYDNWFIETCDDWAVSYLGALVNFQNAGDAETPADVSSPRGQLLNRFLYPRREIANAVRRRRRKGTLSVLEDLATDITRWPSRAVDFSKSIGYFQSASHPEPTLGGTSLITDPETRRSGTVPANVAMSFNDSPFNTIAHTVDVREIQSHPGVGWYHPYKIGLFVWRRPVFSMTRVKPCRVCYNIDGTHTSVYTFDRLGRQLPLYVNRRSETEEFGIAEPRNLPVPLSRELLSDREGYANSDYYGLNNSNSLSISVMWSDDGIWRLIPSSSIHIVDLSDPGIHRDVIAKLPCRHAAVDPECGLFLLRTEEKCQPYALRCSYYYSFGGELGGGEYNRRIPQYLDMRTVRVSTVNRPFDAEARDLFEEVRSALSSSGPRTVNSCQQAQKSTSFLSPITIDIEPGAGGDGNTSDKRTKTRGWRVDESLCIEITTNDTFAIKACNILEIAPNKTLEIRSADQSWPLLHIVADSQHKCRQPWSVKLGEGSRFILAGVQIVGETLELNDGDTTDSSKPANTTSTHCAPCSTNTNNVAIAGTPAEFLLRHTTFVPSNHLDGCHGRCDQNHASLTVKAHNASVCIQRSILGTINVEKPRCDVACQNHARQNCPDQPIQIRLSDSIVDATNGLPAIYSNCCSSAHAEIAIERSTVLGTVCVQQIAKAENCLFIGIVHVERRSIGYMRFCYVPGKLDEIPTIARLFPSCRVDKSCESSMTSSRHVIRTPQRFKCLPDAVGINQTNSCTTGCDSSVVITGDNSAIGLAPVFVSTLYGEAGYCQLALDCPKAILSGADDESELGAFHDLYFPQRMAALEERLQEYTPADIQSAVIYADDLPLASISHCIHRPLC